MPSRFAPPRYLKAALGLTYTATGVAVTPILGCAVSLTLPEPRSR